MTKSDYEEGMTLGRALKERMERDGLGQEQAADQIGVHQSRVNAWLAGKGIPSRPKRAALAGFLGVSEDYLDVLIGRGERARTTADRLDDLEDRFSQIEVALEELRRRPPRAKR